MIVSITIEGAKHCLSYFEELEITEILCDKLGIEDGDTEAEFEYLEDDEE